jgi:hypothetical protein
MECNMPLPRRRGEYSVQVTGDVEEGRELGIPFDKSCVEDVCRWVYECGESRQMLVWECLAFEERGY